jgi:hypothetical protein
VPLSHLPAGIAEEHALDPARDHDPVANHTGTVRRPLAAAVPSW